MLEDVIGPVTPAVAVTAPVNVDVPVTAKVVLAVIALAAKVVLLTVAVPVAAPRFTAVAAPPRFKVVETVLNADCVTAPTNAPARVVVPDAARVVNEPVAGVVAPTVAPSIAPPVIAAAELSVFVATAVAMLLNSVSISVPRTTLSGSPGVRLSLVAKFVLFV
jgi:hypothetical protein